MLSARAAGSTAIWRTVPGTDELRLRWSNASVPFKVGRRTLFERENLLEWIATHTIQPR